jgi:hypothetical protein
VQVKFDSMHNWSESVPTSNRNKILPLLRQQAWTRRRSCHSERTVVPGHDMERGGRAACDAPAAWTMISLARVHPWARQRPSAVSTVARVARRGRRWLWELGHGPLTQEGGARARRGEIAFGSAGGPGRGAQRQSAAWKWQPFHCTRCVQARILGFRYGAPQAGVQGWERDAPVSARQAMGRARAGLSSWLVLSWARGPCMATPVLHRSCEKYRYNTDAINVT